MSDISNEYKPVPFWSWNDELEVDELVKQIDWMYENGIGGFFMHARGGLTTPYLGEKWFKCVEACQKRAKELNMEAYAYDENGWPSGFAGGKLLEDEYNRDMYVTYQYGPYDPKADASFEVGEKAIKKVNKGDNVINIYLKTSASTADVCNEEVVKKFIDLTHEQYKKHDIYGNLRGFFTDEPQYYRWGTPFTRVLPKYFKEHYQEDVFERIALLFVKKEGYRDYRYKYFKAMQDLMLNAFAKQVYDWCEENGYKLTGHYVEEASLGAQIMCCGGVMPFYEYEQIPGVDYLGRDIKDNVIGHQLRSVMGQLDKKRGLCEMFACAGWDATPRELKRIADYLMNTGSVNLVCHHLLPYSEHGQRKRDYPEHYSSINPWVEKDFKEFNNYISKISELLSNSHEIIEVALFSPVRTAYFDFDRELDWAGWFGAESINRSYCNTCYELAHNGIPFHILDENIMAKHARIEGNSLVIGNYKYKFIIIPEGTLTMDKTTEKLFREYANNGGKFLLMKDAPTYLEGQLFNHDYMKNNTSLEEIIKAKPFYSSYSKNINLSYRQSDNGELFIFATNIGEECDIEIKVPGYSSFECDGKVLDTKLHFNDSESKVLYFSNKKPEVEKTNKILKLKDEFRIVGKPLNYLTLDYLQYSSDGINYSNKMHYMGAFNLLLESRYQGELYLKYVFDVKDVPSECEALLEDTRTLEVKVNGKVVNKIGTVLEKDLWKYDIAKELKQGINEIIIKINFIESEQVYYALYGENVTETLKNCLAYDTTIEAIYLRGNFGVGGSFTDGKSNNIINGVDFYIEKQKENVSCLIRDDFPFFRGTINLEQNVEVDDINQTLIIDKRFQMIDLYVNDQFVKRMLFDYKADLSNYLKKGTNKIRLELVVSNRNLLGPHHNSFFEEPLAVGPYTYERLKTWKKDGSSDLCLPRYSFVKTII